MNPKQNHVIKKIGDNIVSPLGFTTEENWRNLLAGHSGQQTYQQGFSLPEPFCASVINNALLEKQFLALPNPRNIRYTKMEKCALLSATDAIQRAGIDAASNEVLFILSTTKGNVELLRDLQGYEPERPYLWRSAQLIAQYFGNPNEPIVVSNACISGCAAQVVAQRQLKQGRYRYAVVIGADVLSQFIISGFQSFKALSPEPCRPFDAERTGLNLGEAAATLVFARADQPEPTDLWLVNGALCKPSSRSCPTPPPPTSPSSTPTAPPPATTTTWSRWRCNAAASTCCPSTASRATSAIPSAPPVWWKASSPAKKSTTALSCPPGALPPRVPWPPYRSPPRKKRPTNRCLSR